MKSLSLKRNNMKNLLITLCLLASVLHLTAQDASLLKYNWEKTPVLHTLSETDQKIPELVLKDKMSIEFAYNDKGELEAYKLHHVIIRVNSDDAINNNNKIYLPYYNTSEMVKQKVRVINSKGKVINLDDDDIKDSTDEETESVLRYFALEGVDLGSEIEYYFIQHIYPRYTGSQITLQSTAPKRDVEFSLITPPNLIMAVKSYNDLPDMAYDSTNEDQNVLNLKLDSVPGLKNEDFSNRDAHLKFLVYKLDANTANNKRDLIRYGTRAEDIYAAIYTEPEGSVSKKLKSMIKEMNLSAITDEEQKVRAVEHFIKSQYQIYDFYAEQLEDLSKILEDKAANEFGMTELFTQLFTMLDIKHQVVLTCSRYDTKFDPDFESYNYLDTYLLYFPNSGKHITPGDKYARLGYLAPAFTNNYGMYIKPVEVGDFKSGVAQVKFIDALPYDASRDDLYVDVDLSDDISDPVYKVHREQTGYYSQVLQMIYKDVDADVQKDLREQQLTFISEDAEIVEVTVKHASAEEFGTEPLLTDGKFTTPQFVEKAGTKYLFNIGLLIGPQAEMYQEEERKLEVENDFNRWYHRELSFVMPDGYTCTNLSDLNMDVFQEKGGERTMTFTSTYTQTGNTVKVVIDEYYKQIIWPLAEFEAYRKVINASADFNKISLVLEPK